MIRKINLALGACAILTSSLVASSTFQEALTSGKVSGDISLRYESRDFDKETSTYYEDTAYAVPSFGLNYETATINNFSASVGYRAYAVVYEDDDESSTNYGTGDARDRIAETEGNDQLSKAYVEYKNGGFDIKVGRKDIPWGAKDWLSKINDGVFVEYENGDLFLETLYTKRRGRVYAHELFPMAEVNNDDGLYHSAITYDITDNYTAKAYYIEAPDSHSTFGGKLFVDHKLSDDFSLNAMLHYTKTSEDTMTEDTDLSEITLGGAYNGYSVTFGYVQNDEDNGFGSADNAGDIVVPFEEGDTMYEADATTYYGMLSKSVAGISLTALYGVTEYGAADFKSSEFNLWAGYSFTDNLSLSLCYAMTDEDSDNTDTYSDMTQLSSTIAYTF